MARKALRRAAELPRAGRLRLRDRARASYSLENSAVRLRDLQLAPIPPAALARRASLLSPLAQRCLEHRFDLLGSGWVRVRHGIRCRGLEGHLYDSEAERKPDPEGEWLSGLVNEANLAEARKIWKLIDPGYVPIDWQLDFKSGYRWSERTWYRDIVFGHRAGVDVKVPWELARMQHLPQLALANTFAAKGEAGFDCAGAYAREFRNQVLDFIAANPPRFGVNWRSAMDAAIRVANWLLAYDLFRGAGASFDAEFERCLARSVHEHALHIEREMKWDRTHPTNHYLAEVAGMFFASTHLEPDTASVRRWRRRSRRHLVEEVRRQFLDDGANFEASLSYHRLSAEMVVYATALAIGFGGPCTIAEFPDWYVARLEKMAEFSMHATKPNGLVAQIGDNDSGRFFKLDPVFAAKPIAGHGHENHLDHRHLVGAIGALLDRDDLLRFAGAALIDQVMVRRLARGRVLRSSSRETAARVRIGAPESFNNVSNRIRGRLALKNLSPGRICAPGFRRRLRLYAYPQFGLYVFRSEDVFVALRCGSPLHDGAGGHAHNDQLAMEVNIAGRDWIADPGSYLYTPLPARRNEYRSVRAHFAPQVDGCEPANLGLGMFRLGQAAAGECLYFGPEGFWGRHRGYGVPVCRIVCLLEDGIEWMDWIERGDESELLAIKIPQDRSDAVPFSPGYGIRAPLQ